MLPIRQAPDPVLSEIAKPISKIDKSLQDLLREMEQTLLFAKDPEGVGLAAPQVGKSIRLFIVKESKKSPLLTFINPEIKLPSADLTQKEKSKKDKDEENSNVKLEGCLSLQDIWGVVNRHKWVECSFLDENGQKLTQKFTGFLATIIQHEVDHLDGTLFPKRVIEQKGTLYKSTKNKKNETIFEEISI